MLAYGSSQVTAPALSVSAVSGRGFAAVQQLFRCLAAQTISRQLEILLSLPRREEAQIPPAYETAFHSIRIFAVGEITSVGEARTPGILAAAADLIVLAEEHCFPAPDWAEQLVSAHARGNHAAISPVFHNANPSLAISWSCLFLEFGPWVAPHTGGPAETLPSNNACYRRQRLLELGASLPHWLERESLLHIAMAAHGWTYAIEPQARVWHINFTSPGALLRQCAATGKRFNFQRSREWSLPRRLCFLLASPAIPILRLARILRDVRRAGQSPRIPGILPWLVAGLAASTFGEFLGCLGLSAGSTEAIAAMELDRGAYTAAGDRIELPLQFFPPTR